MRVDYSRENLMTMHPTMLRAMIVERTHHTVEIQLYQALAEGKPLAPGRGDKVREMLAIWKERGLPMELWISHLLPGSPSTKASVLPPVGSSVSDGPCVTGPTKRSPTG